MGKKTNKERHHAIINARKDFVPTSQDMWKKCNEKNKAVHKAMVKAAISAFFAEHVKPELAKIKAVWKPKKIALMAKQKADGEALKKDLEEKTKCPNGK